MHQYEEQIKKQNWIPRLKIQFFFEFGKQKIGERREQNMKSSILNQSMAIFEHQVYTYTYRSEESNFLFNNKQEGWQKKNYEKCLRKYLVLNFLKLQFVRYIYFDRMIFFTATKWKRGKKRLPLAIAIWWAHKGKMSREVCNNIM